jgi:hypothetical protein
MSEVIPLDVSVLFPTGPSHITVRQKLPKRRARMGWDEEEAGVVIEALRKSLWVAQ